MSAKNEPWFLHVIAKLIIDDCISTKTIAEKWSVTPVTVLNWFHAACWMGNPRLYHSLVKFRVDRFTGQKYKEPFRHINNCFIHLSGRPDFEDLKAHGGLFLVGLENAVSRSKRN